MDSVGIHLEENDEQNVLGDRSFDLLKCCGSTCHLPEGIMGAKAKWDRHSRLVSCMSRRCTGTGESAAYKLHEVLHMYMIVIVLV